MTDSITPEQWLKIANEVEPEHKWEAKGLMVFYNYITAHGRYKNYYNPKNKASRLAIADYLAEKSVYVGKDSESGEFHCFKIRDCMADIISRGKDINLCRALAVLALIGED